MQCIHKPRLAKKEASKTVNEHGLFDDCFKVHCFQFQSVSLLSRCVTLYMFVLLLKLRSILNILHSVNTHAKKFHDTASHPRPKRSLVQNRLRTELFNNRPSTLSICTNVSMTNKDVKILHHIEVRKSSYFHTIQNCSPQTVKESITLLL